MSWDFGATGTQINIGINELGAWHVYGSCWHHCRASGGDISFLNRVQRVTRPSWAIYANGALPLHVDLLGKGLVEYAEQNPEKTCAMISFHQGTPDLLSFTVLASKKSSALYYDFFRDIYGKDSQFEISLHFLGFRVPKAEIEIPSVAEFFRRLACP